MEFVVQDSVQTAECDVGWIHSNGGKAAAVGVRALADGGDAGRDGYIGQAGAVVERKVADCGDAGGDGYTGQVGAVDKRIVIDGGDTGGDGYAGQSCAEKKRMVADGGDGGGDREVAGLAARALDECRLEFVVQDSVHTAERDVGRVHSNGGKAATEVEHLCADGGDAGRDGYIGQAGAEVERKVADLGDAGGDGYAGQAGAGEERSVADGGDGTATEGVGN